MNEIEIELVRLCNELKTRIEKLEQSQPPEEDKEGEVYPEKLPELLHVWYLQATALLKPESYNQNAQKQFSELTDEQRYIDKFIAMKFKELVKKKIKERYLKTNGIVMGHGINMLVFDDIVREIDDL